MSKQFSRKLVQRSIVDDAMVEAAGWQARGDVYWAQGEWGKAIEAFEKWVNCLKWAEAMHNQTARQRARHGNHRNK